MMSSHSYLLTTNHSLLSSHSYCHLIYTYHVQLRCHPPLRFLKYVLLSSSLYPSTMYCCHPVYISKPCTVVIQFISINYVLLSSSLYPQPCTVVIQFISLNYVLLSSNSYPFTKFFNHVCYHPCTLFSFIYLLFNSFNLNSVTWIQIHSQHSIDNLK